MGSTLISFVFSSRIINEFENSLSELGYLNSDSGKFAYIWQSKWVGIIAIKTERTQIPFLCDVLIAVASLDLKVPIWELS